MENKEKTNIFKASRDWTCNACVGHNGGLLSFWDMGRGYFKAADVLSEYVINNGRGADLLIYSIFFNYRHGMELYLKGYLTEIRNYNDKRADDFLNHDLPNKWKEIRKFVIKNKWNYPDESGDKLVDIVDDIIAVLSKHDPDSFHFRYHISKSGEINQDKLTLINIEELKLEMDKINNIFNFWWFMFGRLEEELRQKINDSFYYNL
ncbi:MAG: hypothetical protein M0Q94_14070 [Candidatus Cloacimonetes bacterium]|nr:hypothetical protein [Candidatus Cloacimonadota bacterium]